MNWKDVFVSQLTCSGKSLCYSILPLAFDSVRSSSCSKSIVLIASPLIALMKEQVIPMEERCVTSLYSGDMDDSRQSKVCQGEYRLIFMSPCACWILPSGTMIYVHCVVKWYVKQHLFSIFNMVASFLFFNSM